MFVLGSSMDLKTCQASIGLDANAKSSFFVSDRVFAIDGIKQRERLKYKYCCL